MGHGKGQIVGCFWWVQFSYFRNFLFQQVIVRNFLCAGRTRFHWWWQTSLTVGGELQQGGDVNYLISDTFRYFHIPNALMPPIPKNECFECCLDSAPGEAIIRSWFAKFRKGYLSAEGNELRGRPKERSYGWIILSRVRSCSIALNSNIYIDYTMHQSADKMIFWRLYLEMYNEC